VRDGIDTTLAAFNGDLADPHSFDLLDRLIDAQAYRLAYWRVATEEINYRRFFDINDLAAIRVELPEVFDAIHTVILRLLAEGKVSGLRIDHIDGLFDPAAYLRQLQVCYLRRVVAARLHSTQAESVDDAAIEGHLAAWMAKQQAQGVLDMALAATLGVLASVLGDSGAYCFGRCGGALVLKRMHGSAAWRQAQATFDRYGALAILLTRFVLTPLALPTNLIAGSSRYTFRHFLAIDVVGELIWVALYGGLGYLFADRWEALSELVGNLSGALIGILILAIGGTLAYRSRQRRVLAREPAGRTA
jgi:membrane protein DedA with SNARE-associated domain